MKADSDIKRDVEVELRWSPDFDETDVAVKVNGAVVTLTGFVHSYFDKYQAENAVKRIAGVAGVANDLQVSLPSMEEDPEIARAAVAAVRFVLPTDADNVKVLVHKGHITLEGAVEWNFQRERVESVVRNLRGVMAITNHVKVKPRVTAVPTTIKHMIEDAFRRSAEVDANHISVKADGGTVTLSGKVRTWTERTQAQQTAWSAPGVTEVRNEISIGG